MPPLKLDNISRFLLDIACCFVLLVFALILLAFAVGRAFGAEPPVVTAVPSPEPPKWTELAGRTGRPLRLSAGTAAVRWVLADDTDAAELLPAADGKTASLVAAVPGRYRVLAVPSEGEPARVLVVIGDSPRPTPGPGPAPPPAPAPPLPDSLKAKLKEAFAADAGTAADKSDAAADLAALYRQGRALAQDAAVTSTGSLAARLRAAAETMVGPNRLAGVRKVIAAEVVTVFPLDAPLDDAARKRAADLFQRIEAACKELP